MAKRSHKKPVKSLRSGEVAPKERHGHGDRIIKEVIDRDLSGKALITRQKIEFPTVLDRYLHHNRLSLSEYKAGIKFQHAYMRAVLKVRVEDIGGGGKADPEMAYLVVVHSEKILREAYALLSPKQKEIIINVCGHDCFACGYYKMQSLRRGLEILASLWKL